MHHLQRDCHQGVAELGLEWHGEEFRIDEEEESWSHCMFLSRGVTWQEERCLETPLVSVMR